MQSFIIFQHSINVATSEYFLFTPLVGVVIQAVPVTHDVNVTAAILEEVIPLFSSHNFCSNHYLHHPRYYCHVTLLCHIIASFCCICSHCCLSYFECLCYCSSHHIYFCLLSDFITQKVWWYLFLILCMFNYWYCLPTLFLSNDFHSTSIISYCKTNIITNSYHAFTFCLWWIQLLLACFLLSCTEPISSFFHSFSFSFWWFLLFWFNYFMWNWYFLNKICEGSQFYGFGK